MEDTTQAKSLKEYNEAILPRLQEICEPLKIFGISNFTYGKITKEKKFFRLCTHEKYNELFYKECLYNRLDTYMEMLNCNIFLEEKKTLFFLWNHTTPLEKIRMVVNMWNGISFYQITKEHIETWIFGSTVENVGLSNFYINNLTLLKKFNVYFKNIAKDIIDISNKDKIIDIVFHKKMVNPYRVDSEKVTEFNKKLSTNRYYLSFGNHGFSLSMKELECLAYKSHGLTAKQIAKHQNVSPRTIETYLNNIKVKSGMKNINELVYLCKEEGLL